MNKDFWPSASRRGFIKAGLTLAGIAATPSVGKAVVPFSLPEITIPPKVVTGIEAVRPVVMQAATRVLDRYSSAIPNRDRIAIADFALSSSQPRLHLVDLKSGKTISLLVTHGSGSDPDHSGFLQRFSNQPSSNATSEGCFVTSNYYVGIHGPSQRLDGLAPSNNNALSRAIVIHSAWYANPDMLVTHGKLGRSQGCFVVGEQDLAALYAHLGVGRMLYSAKI